MRTPAVHTVQLEELPEGNEGTAETLQEGMRQDREGGGMNDKLTTAWAYVVAALIYGIFVFTAFAYFGEIVMWLHEVIYG